MKGVKWKSVSSYGNTYTFEKKGDILEGIYRGFTRTEIEGQERLKHLILPDGKKETVEVWESKVLEVLRQLPLDTPVRIEYQGLGKKKRGMNAPRLFSVNIPEAVELIEMAVESAPKARSKKRKKR